MTTPTTSQELYFLKNPTKRPLVCGDIFQCMGWPSDSINLKSLEGRDWRRLTGNMMAIPCIGIIMFGVLATVAFDDLDFTCLRRPEHDGKPAVQDEFWRLPEYIEELLKPRNGSNHVLPDRSN